MYVIFLSDFFKLTIHFYKIQIITGRKQTNCQNVYYKSSKEGTVVCFKIEVKVWVGPCD